MRQTNTSLICAVGVTLALQAWSAAYANPAVGDLCPRPAAGSLVQEPADLRSKDGVLKISLTIRNQKQRDGSTRYCYLLDDGQQSPTLRMKAGDLLILSLKNQLSDTESADPAENREHARHRSSPASNPCDSGAMTLTSTNLHFHGLIVPPLCHQDEVFRTSIQPTDPPFEYRFRIPANEPPGLYWYHPHVHGFSSRQVLGGASGALIVEGLERFNPDVAGLPERVLVIRDQDLLKPAAPASVSEPAVQALIERDGDAVNSATGAGKPGARELWRVLNASSVTYLDLAALFKRGSKFRPQWLGVAVNEPFLRDTVNIPYFHAATKDYPSVRLRMDFRDPNTVGTFVYHCHILDHEDGGMMGLIRVDPADTKTAF